MALSNDLVFNNFQYFGRHGLPSSGCYTVYQSALLIFVYYSTYSWLDPLQRGDPVQCTSVLSRWSLQKLTSEPVWELLFTKSTKTEVTWKYGKNWITSTKAICSKWSKFCLCHSRTLHLYEIHFIDYEFSSSWHKILPQSYVLNIK